MSEKVFRSVEEQLELLKSRGLCVSDEEYAKKFLLDNNYYRISGYSLTLRKFDRFYQNVDFQNIVDIYHFDFELRHILLKYLELLEVKLKSVYAYYFSKKYGPDGYLQCSNFSDRAEYAKIINKSEEVKNKRLKSEPFIMHYVNVLKTDLPLWAYVELFSIGDISRLLEISPDDIKTAVAHEFGLVVSDAGNLLCKHYHSYTIIRNLCAHGGRLFNRSFAQKPSLNRKEKKLLRINSDGTCDYEHLFSYIIVMKRFLSAIDFTEMKAAIAELKNKYSFVSMRYYGFCDNWIDVL